MSSGGLPVISNYYSLSQDLIYLKQNNVFKPFPKASVLKSGEKVSNIKGENTFCKDENEFKSKNTKNKISTLTVKSEVLGEPESSTEVEPKHVCNICSFEAQSSNLLKLHMRIHSGKKPYSCTKCKYECTFLHGMKYHQGSIHKKEKPFKCDECDFACSVKSSLKSHKQKHSDEMPFTCDQCSYRCKYRTSLVYHILKHRNEKSFTCDICSYSCYMKAELKVHKMKHSQELQLCLDCGYRCKTPSTMRKHKLLCPV